MNKQQYLKEENIPHLSIKKRGGESMCAHAWNFLPVVESYQAYVYGNIFLIVTIGFFIL